MKTLILAAVVTFSGAALAETAPYAGQQDRAVSTLSAADLEALAKGDGWGLAKPAELNGWPGPRHVLDEAEALGLSAAQVGEVQAIWDDMNARARAAGVAYVAAERALDAAFREGDADEARIAALTAEAGAALAKLRAVHLNAHLATTPLLTRHQKMIYARLRGYADSHGQGHAHDDSHDGGH